MKNINKTFKYMAMAVASLPLTFAMLTSCSNDENEELLARSEVKFTTAISGAVQSRADVNYAPASGSTLNLIYGSFDGTQRASYTYSASGENESGVWGTQRPLYWDDLTAGADSKYTFYATANAFSDKVLMEQNTETSFTASDLLVARTTVENKNTTVAFTLKHLLSQLEVNVMSTGNNAFTSEELASTSITIDGLKIAYTVNVGDENAAPSATVTQNSTAVNGLLPYKKGTTHSFIAPAQGLEANAMTLTFTVKIGGNDVTYTYKNKDAFTLEAGKKTVFNISFNKTNVAASFTITEWDIISSSNEDISFSPIQVGTITGAAEGDQLTLNLLSKSNTVAATATYTYGADGWGSDSPIYWNNIANDATYSGTFTALYEAADGTWSTGIANGVAHGAAPSFANLTQAMAKMTITLAAGTGITNIDAEVTGRIVKLQKNTIDAGVTIEGKPTTITLGNLENIEFANETAFAVTPQTLTDAHVITLTRPNGNAYTVKLTDLKDANGAAIFTDSKIEGGKHYQITLTVNETGVGITASIAPWTNVEGSGEMKPEF